MQKNRKYENFYVQLNACQRDLIQSFVNMLNDHMINVFHNKLRKTLSM